MTVAGRIAWRAVKWLAVAAVTVLALGLAINAFDDELHPDVVEALKIPAVRVAPEQNLFFALLGAHTVGTDGLAQRGQRIWDRYAASADAAAPLVLPSERLEFVGRPDALCDLRGESDGQSCIDKLRARKAEVEQLIADNAVLLGRYLELRGYRAFQNLLPPHPETGFLPWQVLLNGKRLRHSQMLMQAQGEDQGRLVEEWLADAAFWRRLVHETDSFLLDRMVAVGGFSGSLHFAGELLRQGGLSAEKIAAMEAGLTPFGGAALSLHGPLAGEWRAQDHWVREMEDPGLGINELLGLDIAPVWLSKALARFLFLPDATRNRQYEMLLHPLQQRGPDSCPKAGVPATAEAPDGRPLDRVRNPFGLLLVSFGAPPYDKYLDRLCDLEGLRRLLVIQAAARRQGITAAAMPEFLSRQPPELNDPYTGRPMTWAADASGLRFDARDRLVIDRLPWPL